jgi:glycerophosphoryl diester phosphodiesterase
MMKKFSFLLLLILLVACAAPAPTVAPSAPASTVAPSAPALTIAPSAPAPTIAPSAPAPIITPSAPALTVAPSAPRKPLVVAHRGGAALAPENTLAAFANAIKLGVDMVECDVHLSKDGQVVVMHDPDVSRTTDGRGQIGDLTLAELKTLNAAAKFPGGYAAQTVPTLAELLDLVKGKTILQIEVKVNARQQRYPDIERKVLEQVNARGMINDVIVISFDFPTLVEFKTLEPRVKTGALLRADWFTARGNHAEKIVADAMEASRADYLMPTFAPVTETLVNVVHARGFQIGVWTVDNSADMTRLAGWGVDAITTNRPDELKRVLGR